MNYFVCQITIIHFEYIYEVIKGFETQEQANEFLAYLQMDFSDWREYIVCSSDFLEEQDVLNEYATVVFS